MNVPARNNIYTSLAGVGVLVALLALVFSYLRWQTITGGTPLFFGIF
jgi:hypothetical protein